MANRKVHMKEGDKTLDYIKEHSLRLTSWQEKLIKETMKDPAARMMGSADELQLLANLCKVIGAKKTLDIGVYTGYSALTIALALPSGGKVYALDISDEKVNYIGKPIWKEAGVDNKIDLRIAPALDTMDALLKEGSAGTFDFAFIDADKENYDAYYEQSLKLLRVGGIIAIDNVLWGGNVVNPDKKDPSTIAIRALNDKLVTDDRIDISMLYIGDGLTLAFKK